MPRQLRGCVKLSWVNRFRVATLSAAGSVLAVLAVGWMLEAGMSIIPVLVTLWLVGTLAIVAIAWGAARRRGRGLNEQTLRDVFLRRRP